MDVPDLEKSLEKGNRILLDDGELELEVLEVGEDFIEATVILGGILLSHKGVNLPGAHLNIPGFTEKDRADLEFGLRRASMPSLSLLFVLPKMSKLSVMRSEIISSFHAYPYRSQVGKT